MARGHVTNDYGAPAAGRSSAMRPALLANHALHWVSSVIVMSIAAYFIAHFANNTHLVYWLTIAVIDALLYLPAMLLPALKRYKGYLAPLAWIFSYLWLTAFIFAAQDYNFDNCVANSPSFVNKCALKKTLEAFAFIAFITSLIGHILESRLWDLNRAHNHVNGDKYATAPVAGTTHTQPATTAAV